MRNKEISKQQALKLSLKNKLILVSGSFDLIHLGHLRFFAEAKRIAKIPNKLLIIILDDKNIKERKGETRPIYSISERKEFLQHLKNVDYILEWNENWKNLRKFVIELHPAFLVVSEKDSGLKNKQEIIENLGSKFVILPLMGNYSTTNLVKKLKSL